MARVFDGVAGNNPSLNRFDLSYTNTLSMNFGYLYPVQCDEVTPGDVWKMSAFCHAELMPLVTPVMSDIQLFAHTFFVPYRLIYGVDTDDGKSLWEKFITGGEDGDYNTPLEKWNPTWSSVGFSSLKIWDYIGNPVKYDSTTQTWTPIVPAGLNVSVAPKLSYNFIYNSFYRDENLIDEVDLENEDLLVAAFKKDYFTSALQWQQRGTPPSLPVDVNFDFSRTGVGALGALGNLNVTLSGSPTFDDPSRAWASNTGSGTIKLERGENGGLFFSPSSGTAEQNVGIWLDKGSLAGTLNSGVVYPSSYATSSMNAAVKATTFTVSDLRLAFAIQRMQELSMRAGYRYTEWLSAHYNAHPTDARLDRPEYIGGCVMNVSVSPLVQTSSTENEETNLGYKAGIGRVDSIQKIGSYRVLEHGLIMTLVSIRPKPIYKQGVNRQWLRQVKEDYYIPELAFLSEQGVYNCELFTGGSSDVDPDTGKYLDPEIFGYQAHWNEMRCKNNIVTGPVREQFYHWTLARNFATRPALNQDFIEIDPDDFNQIFQVQDEDPFVVSWSNIIDAYRPIPALGVPGLIDHVYGGTY